MADADSNGDQLTTHACSGLVESLVQVLHDVVDVLDADGEPDHLRPSRPHWPVRSSVSCRCVVEAGWQAKDLASPMFTSRLKSLSAS